MLESLLVLLLYTVDPIQRSLGGDPNNFFEHVYKYSFWAMFILVISQKKKVVTPLLVYRRLCHQFCLLDQSIQFFSLKVSL